MIPKSVILFFTLIVTLPELTSGQNYPDQFYVLKNQPLMRAIEFNDGLQVTSDSTSLLLSPDRTDGSAIFTQQSSQFPFNQGLPSWNGTAPDSTGSFKIQMRFPYGSGWSPWLTIGYWKSNLWSVYGPTQYAGGYIDIDNVKLYTYLSAWQFRVTMTRTALDQPSPTLHKLSFLADDSRTTTALDFASILNDTPPAFFVPTDFIYQYGVDPQIGGSICSPTSVSMILRSYDIPVDPLQFARDTYDPYYDMFGIWPRVVQNASEYGLDGAVTCYRNWSQASAVLNDGGRISMSVGLPLYSGHLIMLAGFTANGDPIVHDPARTDGYAHVFNKSDLSHSWFDKGGVAYTFYPAGTGPVAVWQRPGGTTSQNGYSLHQNYPNPFNPTTKVSYQLPAASDVRLVVYDILGRDVEVLVNGREGPGQHDVVFDARALPSGVYIVRLTTGSYVESRRMLLVR